MFSVCVCVCGCTWISFFSLPEMVNKVEYITPVSHRIDWLIDWVKVLRPTRHKIGHFGDVLPSQGRSWPGDPGVRTPSHHNGQLWDFHNSPSVKWYGFMLKLLRDSLTQYFVQKCYMCFSFWETSSHRPILGLCPWTPLGDFWPPDSL